MADLNDFSANLESRRATIAFMSDLCPECGAPHPGGSCYMRRCDDCSARRDEAHLLIAA
jgi:hypothetical protein